ncbi:Rv1733c family protein [Streptomyces sp. NPDC001635]
MRTRVRGWRWRRNPLRRRSDVVEAWTAALLTVLLCFGAPLAGAAAGLWAYGTAHTTQVTQRAERHQVSAVLLEDAPSEVPSAQGGKQPQYRVKVRWTEPDKGTRTAVAPVPAGSLRGDRADVWLDARDRSVAAPPSDTAVWQHAVTTGVWSGAGAAGAVLLARAVIRRVAQRHRMAEWEAEWARTGPEWGRRTA